MMQRKGNKTESKGKTGWKSINVICIVVVFTFLPMAILLHISSSISIRMNSSSFTSPSPSPSSSSDSNDLIPEKMVTFVEFKDFSLNFTFSPFLSTSNERADIVIGMAQDMDPKYFVVFASSLRLVNNQCVVAILMNELSINPLILEIANKNQINIIKFELPGKNSVYSKYHPSTLRWLLIPSLLKSIIKMIKPTSINPSNITDTSTTYTTTTTTNSTPAVLLIDVRDSYFQRDPFSYLTSTTRSTPFLHVFTGVESITIQNCGWNGGWVKDCFGLNMLQNIGDKNIICSGVTLGDYSTISIYIDTMSALVSGKQPNLAYFPKCERNGVDQGVHNVIVHTNMVPSIHSKVFSSSDGPVSNMQSKLYELSISAKGAEIKEIIASRSREKVYIAHQYDRNTEFQSYLFKRVSSTYMYVCICYTLSL